MTVQAPQRGGAASHLGGLKFLAVARTDVGCVRALNEDRFLNRPEVGLWAVADGMGGHEAGDIASTAIVEALAAVECFSSAYAFRNAVSLALHEANGKLRRRSSLCGSTVVALLVHGGHYACLWAGDSRAYLYRDKGIRRLTHDHTLVQGLVDAGQLDAEEARVHKAGHVVTRAVGAADKLELDCVHGPVRAGDRFVLCSDGFTGTLRDGEIAAYLERPPLEASLDRAMALALARGAPDNVTAVLIGAEAR